MVEDPISGAKIALCLPALAIARLLLCLQWGNGPVRSQLVLLWYSLSPLLHEQAWLCLRLELFMGKFSLSLSFLILSLAILQFGLLSHVSSSDCPEAIQGKSMQPTPPCSALAHWWHRRASGLLLCWELWLGTYSVGFFCLFFPSPRYVAFQDSKTPHRPSGERISCSL